MCVIPAFYGQQDCHEGVDYRREITILVDMERYDVCSGCAVTFYHRQIGHLVVVCQTTYFFLTAGEKHKIKLPSF